MRSIRVKVTGVETVVSEEYFNQYVSQGWFIEILPEPEMLIIETPVKPKVAKVKIAEV